MLSTPTIHVARELRSRISPALLLELARRARRAAQYLALEPQLWSTLGLRIVDDREMAELHLRFMGEEGPTDVLSFAGAELDPSFELEDSLGDIVIDWQAVVRQAHGHGSRAWLDEASILFVHGLAHLLGHDHRDRREGRSMFELERRMLRRLGLPVRPRPYAPKLLAGREASA